MSVVNHDNWDLSEKGSKDASRHREKIDSILRDGIKDVIGQEDIITSKKGRKVRIPVRGLKDWKFRYGKQSDGAGAGQGDGKPGDIIGRQKKDGKGQGDGKPGDQLGEDYLETEVEISQIVEMMMKDLGLPWLDEKSSKKIIVPSGWKFEGITKKGIPPRIHKKKTMIEAIKRNVLFVAEIIKQTKCSEEDANAALLQCYGDLNESIKIIKEGKLKQEAKGVFITDDDLRYKQIEPEFDYVSNAVVIAMMDVSGSMTTDKKYLARSMLFWLVEFLKTVYDNVDIRFITHTTEAKLVDEETFFHQGDSGGTYCHSAFDKANYLIDTEYPVSEWNVYCMYVSDGDDFDSGKTINSIETMINKGISMLGYCEINPRENRFSSGYSTLLKSIRSKWNFDSTTVDDTTFYKNSKKRFLLALIKNKEHIYPALKHFLFEKRDKK